jgi:hypothetical protein
MGQESHDHGLTTSDQICKTTTFVTFNQGLGKSVLTSLEKYTTSIALQVLLPFA